MQMKVLRSTRDVYNLTCQNSVRFQEVLIENTIRYKNYQTDLFTTLFFPFRSSYQRYNQQSKRGYDVQNLFTDIKGTKVQPNFQNPTSVKDSKDGVKVGKKLSKFYKSLRPLTEVSLTFETRISFSGLFVSGGHLLIHVVLVRHLGSRISYSSTIRVGYGVRVGDLVCLDPSQFS